MASQLKPLSKTKIKKLRKLISKMKLTPSPEPKIKPIYDDIYFAGLKYLDEN